MERKQALRGVGEGAAVIVLRRDFVLERVWLPMRWSVCTGRSPRGDACRDGRSENAAQLLNSQQTRARVATGYLLRLRFVLLRRFFLRSA